MIIKIIFIVNNVLSLIYVLILETKYMDSRFELFKKMYLGRSVFIGGDYPRIILIYEEENQIHITLEFLLWKKPVTNRKDSTYGCYKAIGHILKTYFGIYKMVVTNFNIANTASTTVGHIYTDSSSSTTIKYLLNPSATDTI